MAAPMVVAAAPEVVLARLADSIDRERTALLSSSGFAGSKDFVGHVGRQGFRIQRRHKNRNGFAPQLYGHVRAGDGGTQIDYRIQMHSWTKAIMVVWFTMVALLGAAFMTLPGPPPAPNQLHPAVWTAGALLAGIALLAVGRVGWRGDVSALELFMADAAASLGRSHAGAEQ